MQKLVLLGKGEEVGNGSGISKGMFWKASWFLTVQPSRKSLLISTEVLGPWCHQGGQILGPEASGRHELWKCHRQG